MVLPAAGPRLQVKETEERQYMKELYVKDWDRQDMYDFFSHMSNPFYMVTFRQDVTDLYAYAKARGISFYQGMIWACTEALNRVEAFRMGMREGRPVLFERRDPSFTDLKPGSDRFHIVTTDHLPEIDAYCREAVRVSRAQETFIDLSKETDALIYYSCLPWIDLTALTNERDLQAPGALDDSIPRLAWGRFSLENGRRIVGLSMEVNHRFIDGIHIGRFAGELETCIRALKP